MEIFKNLDNPLTKEFEQLLNNQLSKIQIEEGKIINGKINKITEKLNKKGLDFETDGELWKVRIN